MIQVECRNCKTMIAEGINFCPRCGTAVNPAMNANPGQSQVPPSMPPTTPPPINQAPPAFSQTPLNMPPMVNQMPPAGYSSVLFHRDAGYVGCAVDMRLFINGYESGRLSSGTFTTLYLPPGTHDLQVKGPFAGTLGGRTPLFIQPGKNYRIELNVTMGFLENQVHFQIFQQ